MAWHLVLDKEGVQVFSRSVEGSRFKEAKATMIISSTLSELVALVRDTDACGEWAALCAKADTIEVASETDLHVYTLNELPWPVSNRDAVAHVLWRQAPEDLSVTMSASLVSGKLPENSGVVRLSYGETSWNFKPIGDGRVEVISRAHIDPGGAVPAWLTNRLLVRAPFETLAGMRMLVQTGRYADSKFEFVTEP
ncbi:MAG: START domain-containing protein [Proteobacteria bacterium]|nr:START domain-containing protein [Pseudomonadota bacterium]